ncbi:MAG: hypothetical protein VKK04_09595 [Synechococcales bacterium]|nr:hypothetical protein [Synechococcales bacterium]
MTRSLNRSLSSRSSRAATQPSTTVVDVNDAQGAYGFPFSLFDASAADLAHTKQAHIQLDLEGLQCFEVVHQQYQQLGVVFTNAIALRPSNPAFPPHSGHMVLMGAPKNGFLEAIFTKPTSFVSACITGSRRTVVSAFDHSGKLVETVQTHGANLASPDDPGNANLPLSLTAPDIHRVMFQCLGGQFTLDNFSFVVDLTA